MLDPKIDFRYLKHGGPEYYRIEGEVIPSAYAMFWCMLATSTYRIFTREDMKEFLFRLAITLHSEDLVENWLIDDKLMRYSVKNQTYFLTLDDVIMYFGLEILDALENHCDRETYLSRIGKGLFNAIFIGAMADFAVIFPTETDDDTIEIDSDLANYELIVSPELIAKADFFVADLMKLIPDNVFEERTSTLIEKEQELKDRALKIKNLPVFDIKKIPRKTIRQCMTQIYTEECVESILKDKDEFKRLVKPIIYLAWLWSNNFLVHDGMDFDTVEGFELDHNDYDLDENGIFLTRTIQDYNFDAMVPLLKGLLIK